MGLIALCIADIGGGVWEQLALTTLKSVTVVNGSNANGYYRHFMDINTGTAWNSEYTRLIQTY